ncbi:hypothetical protein [Bacillus sp. LL01]|uniref:hypothetical protein n=1 Tax=Bacillus sp. LL01 TaxID=1665556 RepID=UPI00069FF911|nr:hypothetical protein [Bacillus sp. LL01]
MAESPKIPKLELEKFTFSPPGPMGWNMAEYEKMLQNPDQLVLNETTVHSKLHSLLKNELVELSMSGELKNQVQGAIKKEPLSENKEVVEQDIIINEESVESDFSTNNDEVEENEEIMEEEEKIPFSKIKITIIVEETDLKLPWIAFKSTSSQKKRGI